MWSPTHVQVTVQRARGLLSKGKNGTNDAFVTIALGKEKYQTSVKEKSHQDISWHEECELEIPKQGNVAEIVLTALHRNFIGVDEFLGVVNIPLADFDVYERPRNRWYELKSKPGKVKTKARGQLEVKVSFLVKAGSLTDLRKKHRSSLGQLSHMAQSVGGSLLSIGSIENRKGIIKLTKSMVRRSKKGEKDLDERHRTSVPMTSQMFGEADPGVISDGESLDEFAFDELSHKSSGGSINYSHQGAGSLENLAGRRMSSSPKKPQITIPEKSHDEWDEKIFGKQAKDIFETPKRRSWETSKSILSSQPEEEEEEPDETASHPCSPVTISVEKDKRSLLVRKFKHFGRRESKLSDTSPTSPTSKTVVEERIIDGGEATKLSPEILHKYDGKSKEDLIEIICGLQVSLEHQTKRMKDLEDYLDNLLLRVMETTPRILQNPYMGNKMRWHCEV